MSNYRPLSEIKRQSPEKVLAGLKSTEFGESKRAGLSLVKDAASFGLDISDYLLLAIDPRQSDTPAKFEGLNGLEAAFLELNLPFRNDFEQGIVLQAASDTFQVYEGTRAMFPAIIDAMLQWSNRMNKFETTAPLVATSRTINGVEVITTVVSDDSEDRRTSTIAEMANIPVRTLRTSEKNVKIYKHGSGIRTTYEFSRRASLDVLTPFANRIMRELELSKVRAATLTLLNGDGLNGAAPSVAISAKGGTAGKLEYKPLTKWLSDMAKAGTPIDTVVGNWEMYVDWLWMFMPGVNTQSEAQAIAAQGGPRIVPSLPILNMDVNFALSSAMPSGKLLGFTKGETLEEVIEAGSDIQETERVITNQTVTMVKTQNSGYKLAWGDTRSVLDVAA